MVTEAESKKGDDNNYQPNVRPKETEEDLQNFANKVRTDVLGLSNVADLNETYNRAKFCVDVYRGVTEKVLGRDHGINDYQTFLNTLNSKLDTILTESKEYLNMCELLFGEQADKKTFEDTINYVRSLKESDDVYKTIHKIVSDAEGSNLTGRELINTIKSYSESNGVYQLLKNVVSDEDENLDYGGVIKKVKNSITEYNESKNTIDNHRETIKKELRLKKRLRDKISQQKTYIDETKDSVLKNKTGEYLDAEKFKKNYVSWKGRANNLGNTVNKLNGFVVRNESGELISPEVYVKMRIDAEFKDTFQKWDEKTKELDKDIAEKTDENRALKQEKSDFDSKLEKKDEEFASYQESHSHSNDDVEELKEEVENYQEINKTLKEEIMPSRIEEARDEYRKKFKTNLDKIKKYRNELDRKYAKLEERLDRKTELAGSFKESFEEWKSKYDEKAQALEGVEKDYKELKGNYETLENESRERIKSLEGRLETKTNELKSKLDTNKEELSTYKDDHSHTDEEYNSLKEEKHNLESDLNNAKKNITEKDEEIKDLQAYQEDNEAFQELYDDAVSNASEVEQKASELEAQLEGVRAEKGHPGHEQILENVSAIERHLDRVPDIGDGDILSKISELIKQHKTYKIASAKSRIRRGAK